MIGTDIMEEMVEYANKTYGDKDRLKFEVLDIETKNLPEKYVSEFDHIFSFHTLQWCNDIRQAFRNMYRMLRPGKTMLILSLAHQATIFESLEAMTEDTRFAAYMGDKKKYIGSFHYSIRPRDELKEILEDIGFQVHHCSHRSKSAFMNTQKYICKYFPSICIQKLNSRCNYYLYHKLFFILFFFNYNFFNYIIYFDSQDYFTAYFFIFG
ncbi:hypothetical protein ACFW04_009969 [Cataglyphis niger]